MSLELNLEDTIFTKARLGRYWQPHRAYLCSRFFRAPYQFNVRQEIEFMSKFPHDYSDNLRQQLLDQGHTYIPYS